MTNLGVCSIEGCDKPFEARGYCIAHYRRWRRHGNPTAGGTPWGEPEQYFLEIVLSFTSDECLLWPYHKGSNGYGMLWRDNRQQGVHRLACEAIHGPPPTPKHEAAHLCGKGHNGCCNPQHVRWATPAENCADALAHGTQARGERNGRTKLGESDVLQIRALHGAMPQREIAKIFGVSQGQINRIHCGKSWNWIKADA